MWLLSETLYNCQQDKFLLYRPFNMESIFGERVRVSAVFIELDSSKCASLVSCSRLEQTEPQHGIINSLTGYFAMLKS